MLRRIKKHTYLNKLFSTNSYDIMSITSIIYIIWGYISARNILLAVNNYYLNTIVLLL